MQEDSNLSETSSSQQRQLVQSLQQRILDLELEQSANQREHDSLINDLHSSLSMMEQKYNNMQKLLQEQSNSNMHQKMQNYKNEIQELQQANTTLKRDKDYLKNCNEQYKNQIQNLSDMNHTLSSKLSTSEQQREELHTAMTAKDDENSQLFNSMCEIEQAYKKQLDEYASRLDQMYAKYKAVKGQSCDEKSKNLESQIQEAVARESDRRLKMIEQKVYLQNQEKLHKWQEQVKSLEMSVHKLQQEKTAIIKENEQEKERMFLEGATFDNDKQMQQMQKKFNELKSDKNFFEQRLEEKENKVKEYEENEILFKNQIQKLNEKNEQLNTELQNSLTQIQEFMTRTQEESFQHKEVIEKEEREFQDVITKLKSEKIALENRLIEVGDRMSYRQSRKPSYGNNDESLATELAGLNTTNPFDYDTNSNLIQKDMQIQELKNRIGELETELAFLKKVQKQENQEFLDKEKDLLQQLAVLENSLAKYQDLQLQLTQHRTEKELMMKQMNSDRISYSERIKKYEEDYSAIERECVTAKFKLAETMLEKEVLQAQIDTVMKQHGFKIKKNR